jgi:predicted esterase
LHLRSFTGSIHLAKACGPALLCGFACAQPHPASVAHSGESPPEALHDASASEELLSSHPGEPSGAEARQSERTNDALAGAGDDSAAALARAGEVPAASARARGFSSLPLGELPDALVWKPANARRETPLYVVAHGAGGTPEWHSAWLVRLKPDAWVLGLRGKRIYRGVEGFYYPEHYTLERLFEAAVAALAEERPITRARPATYVAFSQGATMGALMLPEHAAQVPRLMLIEGGYAWTAKQAAQFQQSGGLRVYFACGTDGCCRRATHSVQLLREAAVEAEVGCAPGAGHRPDGPVGVFVERGLSWLHEQ